MTHKLQCHCGTAHHQRSSHALTSLPSVPMAVGYSSTLARIRYPMKRDTGLLTSTSSAFQVWSHLYGSALALNVTQTNCILSSSPGLPRLTTNRSWPPPRESQVLSSQPRHLNVFDIRSFLPPYLQDFAAIEPMRYKTCSTGLKLNHNHHYLSSYALQHDGRLHNLDVVSLVDRCNQQ